MTETDRPIIFWDCNNDREELFYTDKLHAIEGYLDDLDQGEWPETITVYGFAPMIAPKPDPAGVLEDVFEGVWEEYLGEDEPEITDRMTEAAQQFVDVLHAEFIPWSCEEITSEEIDVKAWVAANRPHWLEAAK